MRVYLNETKKLNQILQFALEGRVSSTASTTFPHRQQTSRVENPRIQQLVPPNPQITHGHPLSRTLHTHIPIPTHQPLNLPPQPPTSQQPLRRVRAHDARPDRRAHDRLGVVQQERVRGFPQRDAHRARHRRPYGSEVPAELILLLLLLLLLLFAV